jgi:type IV fimbrial biogenesis protein FimT
MQRRGGSQRGFSLGEVLTTLSVVGVSLSLVVPSLDDVARDNARASAVNELVGTLHVARAEAITRNGQVAVCPSLDSVKCADAPWNAGWIRFADNDRDQRRDPGEEVLGTSPGTPGLDISSETFDRAFAYQPSGRIVAPGKDQHFGDFSICDSRGAASASVLVVNQAGLPSLISGTEDEHRASCKEG